MGVVVLRQGCEQREPHLAHATHERLLLHLHALVLQQVGGLVEDLQALGALEGAVLAHHALVLVWVRQVGDVVAASAALVPALAPYLQGGLLRLRRMLLLAVLLPVVRLRRLGLGLLRLWLLGLLLLQGRVRLQHYAVHGAAQGALGPRRDGVNHRGGRGHGVLLPRLRHPGSAVGIQLGRGVGPFAVRIQGEVTG